LIPKDTPGLSFGADETKMGWKSHPTKVLIMENCRVPVKNLLGVEGKGFNIAMSGLNGGRVNIASCSLGGAQKAMLAAKEHLGVRKAFGKTLDSQQYLQYKMAELATQLVTSRLMVRHAAAAIGKQNQLSSFVEEHIF
jgi:isobutyryl-CoA dehydrogenase